MSESVQVHIDAAKHADSRGEQQDAIVSALIAIAEALGSIDDNLYAISMKEHP